MQRGKSRGLKMAPRQGEAEWNASVRTLVHGIDIMLNSGLGPTPTQEYPVVMPGLKRRFRSGFPTRPDCVRALKPSSRSVGASRCSRIAGLQTTRRGSAHRRRRFTRRIGISATPVEKRPGKRQISGGFTWTREPENCPRWRGRFPAGSVRHGFIGVHSAV